MNLTKNISITILDKLMLNGSIDEKNYKNTLYGLEIIISALTQIVGLVIIGMFMGILDKMIRVAFSFALLRVFAGGYHADTCLKCFMMTLVMCVYTISSIDKLYPALIIAGLFMESLSLLVRQNERGRIDD